MLSFLWLTIETVFTIKEVIFSPVYLVKVYETCNECEMISKPKLCM